MHPIDGDLDQLRRLEPTDAYLAQATANGAEVVPVGPFRVIFSPHSDSIWLNQAAPVKPLGSAGEVVEALHNLQRLFRQRNRTPAMEFNEPLWPSLPALLEAAGFTEKEREPLMLCTPADFRPFSSPEVSVRFLQATDAESDLVAYQSIFSRVLEDGSWQPMPDRVAQFRSEVEASSGRCHALATLDGAPAGTGYITSFEGACEITRMATLPPARRRGVAATLATFMIRDRFGRDDTLAWLTAMDAVAQALYQKLGFRVVGVRCYYRP